jgi:hypothetical protein
VGRYADLKQKAPNLKVMLVFADHDHVQPVPDKPHIHQAYDGFRHTAGLWVRLNPDQAYLSAMPRLKGMERYREHPANTEPTDWLEIDAWAYPYSSLAGTLVSQAAVAEMADRTHEGDWSPNLSKPLFPPIVAGGSPRATPTVEPKPTGRATGGTPLSVFYVIHVQTGNDNAPYTDASLSRIDPVQVRNIVSIIQGIAQVAEKHGMPITWEFPQPMAQGLCSAPKHPNPVEALASAGHEIGAYAHSDSIASVYQTLAACGYPPSTIGGFMIDASRSSDPQAVFSQELALAVQAGFRYATVNLSPTDNPRSNPFGALCHNTMGEGNDMWAQTGNLLFPWYPDYEHRNICAAATSGDILFVDHVQADWMFGPGGRTVPVLTDENFATLRGWLDGALAYMDANRPTRPAAWGFVSHISEYTPKNNAGAPPSRDALAALDRFLTYLEQLQDEGKIRLVTVRDF